MRNIVDLIDGLPRGGPLERRPVCHPTPAAMRYRLYSDREFVFEFRPISSLCGRARADDGELGLEGALRTPAEPYASLLHKAVVLPQEQVLLHLRERVERDAHHDQQRRAAEPEVHIDQ